MTELALLGVIGNCQIAAHVDADGSIVWCCMPRFDAEPVFGALLDAAQGGRFTITAAGTERALGVQRYLPNTNVLETRFDTPEGSFRVIDFAPRFEQYARAFRPTQVHRIVEPLAGVPRVAVTCEPVLGWSRAKPRRQHGSHHVRFLGYEDELRLTTDAPLAYLTGEPFALTSTKHFVLSWGQPIEEPLGPLCERFLRETVRYWQDWVKHCEVPSTYQREVIRSALALKLHCYEDTGAIVAALTTSLPEAPGSGRTWDYRYCWLRDAFYTLDAFRLLGHFEERERFLGFLVDVASRSAELDLAPLYRIDGRSELAESELPEWPGFRGEGPVRIGNQAATHRQNDVFGEMVLALTPLFLDERFEPVQSRATLELVLRLGRKAALVAGQADAGIWEYRANWRPQTFTTVMCWAACERAARVARLHRPSEEAFFAREAARIRELVLREAVDERRRALVADHGGRELDAAVLQAITLGLFARGDARIDGTIDAIREDLTSDGWLRRYRRADDFGTPEVAFVLCTFWLVEALAHAGRRDEARATLARALEALSPLGLLAEDFDPVRRVQWGNCPQAYSHAGLVHAAFAVAPPWSEVL